MNIQKRAFTTFIALATVAVISTAQIQQANAGPLFYWGSWSFASEGGLGTTRLR